VSVVVAPWQVWWANLNPQAGREQAGDRPAIVVGTELACRLPNNLVLIVPCTHRDRQLPWQPRVMLSGDPGFAMCDQIKAIDRSRLRKPHAARMVSSDDRAVIAAALRQLISVTS
jgi:mRNA interferase MazF